MAVLAGFLLLGSCGYDDALVREEIGKVEAELSEYEQKMADLESQLSSLTALVNSSFISYLGTDEAGNYVISYMDKGGEVKTLKIPILYGNLSLKTSQKVRPPAPSPPPSPAPSTGDYAKKDMGYAWLKQFAR